MKLKDLLADLQGLTPEQLERDALLIGEGFCKSVDDVWVLEEDHVNPSGDGIEPISTYQDDPDCDEIALEVVARKGTVFLTHGE